MSTIRKSQQSLTKAECLLAAKVQADDAGGVLYMQVLVRVFLSQLFNFAVNVCLDSVICSRSMLRDRNTLLPYTCPLTEKLSLQ